MSSSLHQQLIILSHRAGSHGSIAESSSMKSRPSLRCCLLSCVACGLLAMPAARADIIELQTGQKIEGEVLKERPEELVVDIGVDVVRIPLAQIKHRTVSKVTDTPAPKGNEESLYLTGELPH